MNDGVRNRMSLDNARVKAGLTRPFLITFSGIDGAGKTTQIERVKAHLEDEGLRVLRLSFWEHVAVWSNMRSEVAHRAAEARRESLTTSPTFSPRNNKHIRKWYLTAVRSGFYVLDVGCLRRLLASRQTRNYDVVIFDRYVYDQVANIYSQSFATRSYATLLLKGTPIPDLAFVIDALPTEAFARKPEYPLEFLYRNRRSFLRLRELLPELIVTSASSVEGVEQEIHSHLLRSRLVERALHTGKTEAPAQSAVIRAQTFPTVQDEPTANL
jgi:thymidylate kinase